MLIGALYLRADPGAFIRPVGAGGDHRGEVVIERDAKRIVAQKAFQAAVEMKLCREQHRTRIGRPPQNRFPGEYQGKMPRS